jgi:polyisoprenoid-binding protein YceI
MKKTLIPVLLAFSLLITSCEKTQDRFIEPTKTAASEQAKELAAAKSVESPRQYYTLDTEKSLVEWKGYSPADSHHGAFSVQGQSIEVVNGKVKSGSFTIHIASIQNFDLPDHIKPVLLEHLKSPDFFHMALYPEAKFVIKRVTPLAHRPADANILVTGDFTMIGKTREINFPATIEFSGDSFTLEASFSIDRTNWGMTYAADPALGDHHIYPEVDLHLKLRGNK